MSTFESLRAAEIQFREAARLTTKPPHATPIDETPEQIIWQTSKGLIFAIRSSDCPLNDIQSQAMSLAHFCRSVIRGDYISRWTIADDTLGRFRSIAVSAARAAGLVEETKTDYEAADHWLDLLAKGSTFYRATGWIEDLFEASAQLCATLALQVYAQASTSRSDGGTNGIKINHDFNWAAVEIRFVSDDEVEIVTAGVIVRKHYGELGFADGRGPEIR
jgi:hypothetical protein